MKRRDRDELWSPAGSTKPRPHAPLTACSTAECRAGTAAAPRRSRGRGPESLVERVDVAHLGAERLAKHGVTAVGAILLTARDLLT